MAGVGEEPLGGGHPGGGELDAASLAAPAGQLGVGFLGDAASTHHASQLQGVDDVDHVVSHPASDIVITQGRELEDVEDGSGGDTGQVIDGYGSLGDVGAGEQVQREAVQQLVHLGPRQPPARVALGCQRANGQKGIDSAVEEGGRVPGHGQARCPSRLAMARPEVLPVVELPHCVAG
ncbi:MAG: hypothetical protein M3256_20925 [Actinomycetota bacterium]|nr:hypothetical protein [Actinomycetota bacterium]